MPLLLHQPLRRKLLIVTMVASTAALMTAAAAFSFYEWFNVRESTRRDVLTQAEILAANISAAAAFADASHARLTLQTLQTRPQFDLVCLFDENKSFLAGFTNGPARAAVVWPSSLPAGVHAAEGHLAVFHPVLHNGEMVGTLYLRSRFAPIKTRFLHYLGLVTAVLLASWWGTFWLATRLQRVVSGPILGLARTMGQVSERKDYSIRASEQCDDEVGSLIVGFNEMLAQIQARDNALRLAHDELEQRVNERTAELQKEINERQRFEAALADEKERLAVTLGSIADAVVATDREGRIALFNPVAEQLTGWQTAEAKNRFVFEVLHLLDHKTRQPCLDLLARLLKEGDPLRSSEDLLLISRSGEERLIASSSAPIRDPAREIMGVVLVFHDVTEKERTAQELLKASKLESVGLLAGGIAHDFNNILTVILGNVSLARQFAPPLGTLADCLTQAENAATRAGDLTRQLLTFSKGGLPVKQTASLQEIIKETTSFVLHGSNIALRLSLSKDLWPASIDVGQISQVIHNLTLNAIQAMPSGGTLAVQASNVKLEENVRPSLGAGRYISIVFQDSGSGIAPEHLLLVFDPYFTTKKQGSGLGLATSYSIIRKHEGDISVQSEVGRGTRFQIYLPASSSPVLADVEPAARSVAGRGRLLVMDDETPIRLMLGRLLQQLGYEVITTADGTEAISQFQKAQASRQPFSAVILDLTVPGGMGGCETLRHLRQLDPRVKAIVSSGYSQDPILANYRAEGFAGMVAKPYRLQEFSRVLQEILG